MRGDKEVYKKANGFDKNPQNINKNGRPKKTLSAVNIELEEAGITKASVEDVTDCYLRLINTDVPTLREMVGDDNQPSLVRIVGKAIVSGKGFDVIEAMLNRAIGKAASKLDITTQGEKIQNNIDPFAIMRENHGINEKTETSD